MSEWVSPLFGQSIVCVAIPLSHYLFLIFRFSTPFYRSRKNTFPIDQLLLEVLSSLSSSAMRGERLGALYSFVNRSKKFRSSNAIFVNKSVRWALQRGESENNRTERKLKRWNQTTGMNHCILPFPHSSFSDLTYSLSIIDKQMRPYERERGRNDATREGDWINKWRDRARWVSDWENKKAFSMWCKVRGKQRKNRQHACNVSGWLGERAKWDTPTHTVLHPPHLKTMML